MSEPAIELRGLSHRFDEGDGAVSAVQDISLSVAAGSFVSVVGPSGCGKSTLLRVLAGLLIPTAGQALVRGRSVIDTPGLVGYMPQRDLLLPWRRALANATLGAEIAGEPVEAERESARGLFPQFGLAGFEDAWPAQLSGGMAAAAGTTAHVPDPFRCAVAGRAVRGAGCDHPPRHAGVAAGRVDAGPPHGALRHARRGGSPVSLRHGLCTDGSGRDGFSPTSMPRLPRPRLPSLVVESAFVQCKARLLAALDRGR